MCNGNERKEITIECPTCRGTGLIIHRYFKDDKPRGVLLCTCCDGTGFIIFKYREFNGLKYVVGVTEVFDGSYPHGCSYEDFLQGGRPIPIEKYYCPLQWKYRRPVVGIGATAIARCKTTRVQYNRGDIFSHEFYCFYFEDKEKCWAEFNAKKKK